MASYWRHWSYRIHAKIFGWIDLFLASSMLTFLGVLGWKLTSDELDIRNEPFLSRYLGSWEARDVWNYVIYGQGPAPLGDIFLVGELVSYWLKLMFVSIDQFVRMFAAVGLIMATDGDIEPEQAISLTELGGMATKVLLFLTPLVGTHLLCGLYFLLLIWLPFKWVYFVVVRNFMAELKETLDPLDWDTMTLCDQIEFVQKAKETLKIGGGDGGKEKLSILGKKEE